MPAGFLAIISAVLFGLSTPLSKLLLSFTCPWLLAGTLYSGSGLGIFILSQILKWARPQIKDTPIKRENWKWLAVATITGGGLAPVFLLLGLSHSSASSASLLLNLEAVFSVLLAWTIFKEQANKRIIIGMTLIVSGGIIQSWTPESISYNSLSGPFFIIIACLCWGIDNNVTRKISSGDPLQITMIKSIVAGGMNLLVAAATGAKFPQFYIIALGSLTGFIFYGLSLVCFILSLRKIGTSRTSAYFSVSPFIGSLAAIAFLHETAKIEFIFSFILMSAGVYLFLTESHDHEHTHESLKHDHLHDHDEHHKHEHCPDDPIDEPHSHTHIHEPLVHSHPHFPDIHHRHLH